MFAYVCLFETMIYSVFLLETMLTSVYLRLLLLTPHSVSFHSKENTVLCLFAYLFYSVLLYESENLYVHMLVYTVVLHPIRLYTRCLFATLPMLLGMIVYACLILILMFTPTV